ncbi:uncharacterized protein TNCV_3003411 [Trichonephila clavipes]|nr:uncharacterized protein TNCV_3003411 [Trichonephila clavipes]
MVSWEYLRPTLRYRRVAGVSPFLSIGWWYLSSVSPKRHCCRVSAADKGCRVYPLDLRPDAVALYSGCTSVSKIPHKTLNSCRGVISEPDLLTTPEPEVLEGFSKQGVIQCQRFGHSQTSCRGQLTCSRYASVGHSSTDCTLEPKCINCTQSHLSDSKLCQKWKLETQIQEIKTNKNVSYFEARKFIVPQLTQTYAQNTKPSSISTTTQTDPNITNIICPPLQYLKPLSSEIPMPNTSSSVSTVSTSCSSTQENLPPSPSAIIPPIQKTETRSLTTLNKFAALSTETQSLVPLPVCPYYIQ